MLSADVEIKVIIKDDTDPNGDFNGLIIFRTPYIFFYLVATLTCFHCLIIYAALSSTVSQISKPWRPKPLL